MRIAQFSSITKAVSVLILFYLVWILLGRSDNKVPISSITYKKPSILHSLLPILYMHESSRKNLETEELYQYSNWPTYLNVADLDKNLNNIFLEVCLDSKNANLSIEIENLKEIFIKWSENKNVVCSVYYELFSLIYQVKFKQNKIQLERNFAETVKSWLGNDKKLLEILYKQVKILEFITTMLNIDHLLFYFPSENCFYLQQIYIRRKRIQHT